MRNRRIFVSLLIVSISLLAIAVHAQPPAAKTPVVFTEKDREFALKYLGETKEDFVKQRGGIRNP